MKISTQGYRDNSPDNMEQSLIIPSNTISMKGVSKPITAIPIINGKPDYSKKRVLQPEQDDAYFEGAEAVLELPFAQSGMMFAQNGFLPNFNFQDALGQQGTVGQNTMNFMFPNLVQGRDAGVDWRATGNRINNPQDLSNISPQGQAGQMYANSIWEIPRGFSYNDISTWSDVDGQSLNPQNTMGIGTIGNEWQEVTNQIQTDNNQVTQQQRNPNNVQNYLNNLMQGFGSTRDLSSSLTRAGYGFGFNADDYTWASPEARSTAKTGNTLATIGAVGNSLLKGAKDFMSGMASANREQQAVNEYHENMAEALRNRTTNYYQKGGQMEDEMILTGAFTTGIPQGAPIQPNAELEKNEFIQKPDGSVQKVLGDRHSQGGELMNLEGGTKVISDYVKVGGELSRKLSKNYDLSVKATNTFATVIDKYKKKIGLTTLLEDYQKTIGKIKDQEEVENDATKELNLSFLSKKVQELESQKAPMDAQLENFTSYLFEEQEALKTNEAEKSVYKKGGLKLYQEGGAITPQQTEQILQQYAQMSGISYEQLVQQFAELTPQEKETTLKQMVQEMEQTQVQGNDQIGQLIQAYAQSTGNDPNQVIQQLQQLPEAEQQQALQEMSNSLSQPIEMQDGGTIVANNTYNYNQPNRTGNFILNLNDLPDFALPNPQAVVDWQLQHQNPNNPLIYDNFDVNQRLGWYNQNIPYVAMPYIQSDESMNWSIRENLENPVLNFQKDYNNYLYDTRDLMIERGYGEEEVNQYVDQMRFLEDSNGGNTARGFDNKLGQFTSTRGTFQIPIVTPDELKKLNESGIFTARQALNNEEIAKNIVGEKFNDITKGLDKYENADFTISVLKGEVPPTQETPPTQTTTTNNNNTTPYTQQGNNNAPILPWSEINQSIPFPMGMEFGRLQSVSPINIQPVNISPQEQINQVNRQVDLANAQIDFAPDATRGSQIANILASSTDAINQAVATTNLQNAQMNQQVEQYNENQVGAADRMNTELAENYTQRYLQTRAALEGQQLGWYNYMNQLAGQQSQRRWNANLASSLFPNFRVSADGNIVVLPDYLNQGYQNTQQPENIKTSTRRQNPDGSTTTTTQTSKKGGTIRNFLENQMFNKTNKA